MKNAKQDDACKIHGNSSRAVNKTLLFLILASLSLVIWHVWTYGPAGHAVQGAAVQRSFFTLLGYELWDLLFDSHGVAAELLNVLPYFLIGIFLAGLIRTYKLAIRLRNSLIRYGFMSIVFASLVGVLTPLCACGILTTAVSLIFAGLPLAPVMALLVSSPLISPSAYLLTLNDLGPHWTVIRTLTAFLMGIFAGVLTHALRNRGFRIDTLIVEGAIPRGDFHDHDYPDENLRCNCKEKFGNRVARKTDNMFVIFLAKSSDMLWLVGKYVLVGITVGAILERYMPSDWIFSLFGTQGKFNIVWITLGAIPIFLHQISASSILHHIKSSLDGTLNSGAGLAFLIGGPVTAVPTMIMLWTIFKKRVFALYMFICVAGTIMFAYSFQYLLFVPNIDTDNPLLRGVASVSGGNSPVLSKVNKDVKIVMNPGGKNIIATYDNDIEGKGGIVFDAGAERFLDASIGKYDNRKYVMNTARWLEDHNNSLNDKSILIYDTSAGARALSEKIPGILNGKDGFSVQITDRGQTPEITGELLDRSSQLWIILGAAPERCCLTDDELERIVRFTEGGGSMLIAVDYVGNSTAADWTSVNRIAGRFGVRFSGSAANSEEIHVSASAYFFERVSSLLGSIYRFMT